MFVGKDSVKVIWTVRIVYTALYGSRLSQSTCTLLDTRKIRKTELGKDKTRSC